MLGDRALRPLQGAFMPSSMSEDILVTGYVRPDRYLGVVFVALAQLMIAFDATIMNVALPSLQQSLGFADGERQWVITAYTVAFGSLLLLGGRLSDRLGHHRAFALGLFGFASVSALGALSTNLVTLCAARATQGAFAALLGPTTLALITRHAQVSGERAKTFALFGAIAGSGGVVGLVLGGLLTSHFSWRICFWINIPIALIAALGQRHLARTDRGEAADARQAQGARASAAPHANHASADARSAKIPQPSATGRLDVLGALLATAGLGMVVAGLSARQSPGFWLMGGLLSLGLLFWHESRTEQPLLPSRIWKDRDRAGAYVAAGVAVAGMLGLFLSLTFYFQGVRHYTPLQAGLAFLPLSAAVFGSSQVVARLLPRLGARTLIVLGLVVASCALLLLGQLDASTNYATQLLPAELLLGVGMGAVFTPALTTATANVARNDAGIASALVHASQQVGGSIGVAAINAIAASDGHTSATRTAAAMLAGGALLAAALMRRTSNTTPNMQRSQP